MKQKASFFFQCRCYVQRKWSCRVPICQKGIETKSFVISHALTLSKLTSNKPTHNGSCLSPLKSQIRTEEEQESELMLIFFRSSFSRPIKQHEGTRSMFCDLEIQHSPLGHCNCVQKGQAKSHHSQPLLKLTAKHHLYSRSHLCNERTCLFYSFNSLKSHSIGAGFHRERRDWPV